MLLEKEKDDHLQADKYKRTEDILATETATTKNPTRGCGP